MGGIGDYLLGDAKGKVGNAIILKQLQNKVADLEYKILNANKSLTKEALDALIDDLTNKEKSCSDDQLKLYKYELNIRKFGLELKRAEYNNPRFILSQNRNKAIIKRMKFFIEVNELKRKIELLTNTLNSL